MDNACSNRHAYLIMAHNHFDLLKKLLLLLDDNKNDIYIHIDKKVKNFDFSGIGKVCLKARVYFTPQRIRVRWGHASQTQTEMLLYETAYAYGPYSYYHLLSGADLPLKSQAQIHRFFQNQTQSFLWYDQPTKETVRERLSKYYFFQGIRNSFVLRVNRCVQYLQNVFKTDRLKGIELDLYKGSNWGSLTQQAVKVLLENKKLIKRLTRFSLCADEVYKQTILINMGCPIVRNDLRRICWQWGAHPKVYTQEDFNWLWETDAHFARKFDPTVDSQVIELVCQRIQNMQE